MEVLYISALASKNRIEELYRSTGNNPGFAVQKFSRMLVKGMISNRAKVLVFSNSTFASKFFFVSSKTEKEDDISYKYIPNVNIPIIKHICIVVYSFLYIFFWGIKRRKEKAIVCDVLSVSTCIGALLASKLNRLKSVGVVTDIYSQMAGNKGLFVKIAGYVNKLYITSFDRYVLLTEQMNELVNPKRKPYIIMEGLCDSTIKNRDGKINEDKGNLKVMLYAGGIHEQYGLKMLAEAFVKANIANAKLVYYGSGPYVEEYKALCAKYSNVEYRGVALNEEIIREELKASILVNPRFTTEDFSKYSFPSKNMEYMSTGVPLLTTKLPGMPEEYYPYVYLFKEETIDGYSETIKEVLNLPSSTLEEKGKIAKEFVLKNKNNIVQSARILELLNI